MTTPNQCPICGGTQFDFAPVLAPALIAAWELNAEETRLIDRQQGLHCSSCQANLRSMTLAAALLKTFGSPLYFEDFCRDDPTFSRLRILEINPAGSLSAYLSRAAGHQLWSWPDLDLQKLAVADGSWDVILHSDTLEHVPNYAAALQECGRALRPGGWLAFTVPLLPHRLTRPANPAQPSYHGLAGEMAEGYQVHTEFGADTWAALMTAGFDEVQIHRLLFPESVAFIARKPLLGSAEFTGERLLTTFPAGRRIATEHLHRYALAAEVCQGQRVLDLASGEGYGSALLSRQAAHVTGVDLSASTVAEAQQRYGAANLAFLQGSATAIPLPAQSVARVVSFETLEHLPAQAEFLTEISRVLTRDGLLLISTPDRAEYSERHQSQNPHHEKELSAAEFRALLEPHFKYVALVGQRYVVGSWMESAEAPAGSLRGLVVADYAAMPFAAGVPEAVYWLAVCSNAPLPALPLGVCVPPRTTLDGWLEALEVMPAPAIAMELAQQQHFTTTQPVLAKLLAQSQAALAKQRQRAETWKERAERAKAALAKAQQASPQRPSSLISRLAKAWRGLRPKAPPAD